MTNSGKDDKEEKKKEQSLAQLDLRGDDKGDNIPAPPSFKISHEDALTPFSPVVLEMKGILVALRLHLVNEIWLQDWSHKLENCFATNLGRFSKPGDRSRPSLGQFQQFENFGPVPYL